MSTNLYDAVRSAIGEAEDDAGRAFVEARREYDELGQSLKVANAERLRLTELLEAALDLLEPTYGLRASAETAVCARVQARRRYV